MSNPYFQFKQFTVYHNRCALKVSTDSCLLGAFVAQYLKNSTLQTESVLDIGAGSGLLMLMLAQQYNGKIEGIEIDPSSFHQAIENIQSSAWKDRLQLYLGDTNSFSFPQAYDFIISNPPFFEGELKSEKKALNLAKHDTGLTLANLLKVVDANTTHRAQVALLLPYHRMEYVAQSALSHHFYVLHKLLVRQTRGHAPFRCILLLGRVKQETTTEELVIYEQKDTYSDAFIDLLKNYYLKL